MSSSAPVLDRPQESTGVVGRSFKRPSGQQSGLAVLLLIEILFFCGVASRFTTWDTFFAINRDVVELGLVALPMTVVIVTGGIDLSVGSLMSLCAVLVGKLWQFGHVAIWIAVAITLVAAVLAGGLNALLVTRLRIPALIVTLGTYSLFSGVAEGLAYGRENPSGFPASFVYLGNGYLGKMPFQVILLLLALVFFWILLHRTTIGRALSAIGYSPQGARYAGIPVDRRIALCYILSGLCAGLAALVAVARVNTAKADTGSGYELLAITAVVLGGTSIFGGRGSIAGTVLGFFAIIVLKDGLLMTDRPDWLAQYTGGELAGILTGVLLLLSIGLEWRPSLRRRAAGAGAEAISSEGFQMKNSQLAVLCVVILIAALIVTSGNFLLVNSLRPGSSSALSQTPTGEKRFKIAMMPKSKGNGYFVACEKGAQEAAKELNVELTWDGPVNTNPSEQSRIIDTWVNRGFDAIAVAVEDSASLSTALENARRKGIKVITYDADSAPAAREFFVNQGTPQDIGFTLVDDAATILGGKGDFAVITASLNASNMNAWLKEIRKRLADKYPDMNLVDVRPCDDQKDKAFEEAKNLLNSQPNLKLIMAICSPAVPGAAEAVKQSKKDVKVMGLGLPSENKRYVQEGLTQDVVLWNVPDLGYLTVYAADELLTGKLKSGDTSMNGGKLGPIKIEGDNILLGKPVTFTKENIEQYDF